MKKTGKGWEWAECYMKICKAVQIDDYKNIYLLFSQTAVINQITYICPVRALTTIIQSFRIVGVLQDLTYNHDMGAAQKGFNMLWGKEINSSVGHEKGTSSAGQKKFTVQLEKHRFQTLSVQIQ